MQGWALSTSNKRVAVKSFLCAKIEDMEDYLRPLLRKDRDEIILHVGTNNVRDESARIVAECIVFKFSRVPQLRIRQCHHCCQGQMI